MVESKVSSGFTDDDDRSGDEEKPGKRRKPGIIYLSSIPINMNVSKIREYFSKYGEIDRVFLQPSKKNKEAGKKSKRPRFTEGWIEFKNKRRAKDVHLYLNNEHVGGKKTSKQYDVLWNIKYLPRFKWAYLSQRLEYEREVRRQRMNMGISQARKETDHYIYAAERSEKARKLKRKLESETQIPSTSETKDNEQKDNADNTKEKARTPYVFKQKLTEEEVLQRKEAKRLKTEKFRRIREMKKQKRREKKGKKDNNVDSDFLGSVFVGK
ncbi:uncharacterized protein LOC143035230 [Oratosquilla oratoria]|uniref:uncharacterized protein LOC143035230 n=1 Tax=Oratosquilla oratoria TaxID=337810 RepID=UPI003F7573BE